MDNQVLEFIKGYDTPTIVNAIEVALGSRDFKNYTKKPLVATVPSAGAVVGWARTARIRAKEPPKESQKELTQRRTDYYRYLKASTKPSLLVMEDLDYPDTYGAWWGEVNSTIHKGFGLAGVLTNGQVRDLDELVEGFPILAGSVGVSHAFVHLVDIGKPVEIFGLKVVEGDLIHVDKHGATAIPAELIDRIPESIEKLIRGEAYVISSARRKGGIDINQLNESWEKFSREIRK